jgi:hypothetical protein
MKEPPHIPLAKASEAQPRVQKKEGINKKPKPKQNKTIATNPQEFISS